MIDEQNGKILNCDGASIRNDTPNQNVQFWLRLIAKQ
jgi:hypothetical protein